MAACMRSTRGVERSYEQPEGEMSRQCIMSGGDNSANNSASDACGGTPQISWIFPILGIIYPGYLGGFGITSDNFPLLHLLLSRIFTPC
jgi:hypothetical protein